MKYLLLLVIGLSVMPFSARADILPEGQHAVMNCFSANVDDWSAYDFKLVGEAKYGSTELTLRNAVICGGAASIDETRLLAIKKTDVSKIVNSREPECPECGNFWWLNEANVDLVIWSDLVLKSDKYVSDSDPTVSVTREIQIDNVTEDSVDAHLVSIILEDESGARSSAVEVSDDVLGIDSENLLIGILIGLGVLGLILVAKKK